MDAVVTPLPQHRRMRAAIYSSVVILHIAVIAVLVWVVRQPVRLRPAGAQAGSIEAYVPGPVGTTGAAPKPAPVRKPAPSHVMRAQPVSQPDDSGGSGQSQAAGDAQGAGSGPVRLGTGENLTLLKKVVPIYPRLLETARIPGTVTLDAVIHQDGSIGDVRVLSSTNDLFAQAAVAAVRQWQYSPIPHEGIVTVTVNFTVPR